jgi:integrase
VVRRAALRAAKALSGTNDLPYASRSRLIAAATGHLKPLLIFLLGTGARVSEALLLDWQDVDLAGGRAIFWQTKSGKRRVAELPPRVIAALAELPHREGRVFRHQRGDYTVGEHRAGGEFRSAWLTAIRRAGLDPKFTPHVCRHTWATWHYALNKDLLGLKAEGGWGSVSMVERYAKLMPAGYEGEIRRFLGDEM